MRRLIWLRHETKPFEERVALTPMAAKKLLDLGHQVVVERSHARVFADIEYEQLGCEMAETNSWKSQAPDTAIILGLKELEEEGLDLIHRHIFFAHAYKGQDGAKELLNRFVQGHGKLYDLEYLVDENQRRIAAFGVWAGFTGAGLAVDIWAHQQLGLSYNHTAPLKPFRSSDAFISSIASLLKQTNKRPRTLIIGAHGRCGSGAHKLLQSLGLEATLWGSKETKDRGPISEILDYDILINTVLMTKPTPPFLTEDLLDQERHLSVISDVSCDPTGPCNPLPIYKACTTMDKPVLNLRKDLELTAIDHLPSLLPRESSEDFCEQLLPHLINFLDGKIENSPWERSLALFFAKSEEMGLAHDGRKVVLEEPTLLM